MSRPGKIDALTGLRFIAAAMIVIHHSRGVFCIPGAFLAGASLQQGVSFFFVLSGFILTHAYPALQNGQSVGRFLVARIARVWPAHLFTLAAAILLGFHQQNPGTAVAIANAGMLHAWVPAKAWFFSFNAVSWSISTEFFFYLMFPLLIRRFSATWLWKLGIAASAVFGAVMLCEHGAILPFAEASAGAPNRAGILYISPVTRLFEFIMGMVVALKWRTRAPSSSATTIHPNITEAGCVLFCVASVVCFSGKALLVETVGQSGAVYLGHSGSAFAFALLIYIFADQRGILSRMLARPVPVLLGEISFSVYLLHQLLIRWFVEHRDDWQPLGAPLTYSVFLAVLLTLAWSVWRFVEKPARTALMRFAPAQ